MCVIPTPRALKFIDRPALEASEKQTGFLVHSEYEQRDIADPLPPPDDAQWRNLTGGIVALHRTVKPIG